ncbi:uncharacterized protein [Arachis hypogaea]|uniref:uncharacterized protein n=1 Tax=Arachis hypogaea TaxID=3818 RepID=UPI003B21B393
MTPGSELIEIWKLHVDGSSNTSSGGAGVILENKNKIVIEQSIRYKFPISNNQAEYEALLAGLMFAKEVTARTLEICSDSQIVRSQINGDYQTRDTLLQHYLAKIKELTNEFEQGAIQHIPRKCNVRADLLSKLASTKPGQGNQSLIQETIKIPCISAVTIVGLPISSQSS